MQLVKAGNALSRAESMSRKQASSWFSRRRWEVGRPFSATFRSPFSGLTYSSGVTSVAHVQLLSSVRSQVITTQPRTLCVCRGPGPYICPIFLWNLVMFNIVERGPKPKCNWQLRVNKYHLLQKWVECDGGGGGGGGGDPVYVSIDRLVLCPAVPGGAEDREGQPRSPTDTISHLSRLLFP